MDCHEQHLRDVDSKQGSWKFDLHVPVPSVDKSQAMNTPHNEHALALKEDIETFKKERNGCILLFLQGVQRQLIEEGKLGRVSIEIQRRMQLQLRLLLYVLWRNVIVQRIYGL